MAEDMTSINNSNEGARSRELFESGFYCAESVLLAIAESKGIESDLIPKIATGFCSGISRTCGMCGAVSGGILAINMLTGRSSPKASIKENYDSVKSFIHAFEERFNTTNCRQLIDCDLGTEEGQKTFNDNKLIEQCKQYTEEATKMVMEILDR
jgi:C_GCAxxG_C_C family probable redox protein